MTTGVTGRSVVNELHRGRASVIYRGRDADGRPVVFKTLRGEHRTPDDVARFRHEYEIASSVADLPGVVTPYAFEVRGGVPVMILEDFGGVSLRTALGGRALDPLDFLR